MLELFIIFEKVHICSGFLFKNFRIGKIKGPIGQLIDFKHSQGHKNEPMTLWINSLQEAGTNVSATLLNKIYSYKSCQKMVNLDI